MTSASVYNIATQVLGLLPVCIVNWNNTSQYASSGTGFISLSDSTTGPRRCLSILGMREYRMCRLCCITSDVSELRPEFTNGAILYVAS